MNILIVGSKEIWAFENHYIKNLMDLNIKVSMYPAQNIFYKYYYKNLVNKLIHRAGLSKIYDNINKRLLKIVYENNYDIVWIFKGMEIFPDTITKIKDKGCKVVNFNPDNPFEYTFRGSGNKNVLNSIDKYDLHLCYKMSFKERIENEYHISAIWLPFGYEETEINLPDKYSEIKRVCFIGNPDGHRADIIEKLAAEDIPLDIYGHNWKKWIKPNKKYDINYYDAVYSNEFNKIAPLYRIQLNIFRPQNKDSHNMRTFEMPGLGCIMLAPHSKEHCILFKDKEEAFFYNDFNDLLNKSIEILNLTFDEAAVIRKNAIKRCVNSGYSYKNRAKEVVKIFNDILIPKI